MKITNALLLLLFLLSFSGCEDKKNKKTTMPVENTVQSTLHTDNKQITSSNTDKSSSHTFTLADIEHHIHTFTLTNKNISSDTISTPVILINLFATWCTPCKGEIPYLSDLQKKYKNTLFIAGVLVQDKQKKSALKTFISKNHADYFISNSGENDAFAKKVVQGVQLPENFPLPLTILYKEGNYYIHYEGAVPIEMIEHDIKEIIK